MIMMYIIASLIILASILFLTGIFIKNKIIRIIGVVIITAVIIFVIGFIIYSLYEDDVQYKSQFGQDETNNSNNEQLAIDYYKKKLESIPKELTVEDAVKRNYFVYDGVKDKVYNEEILKDFVKNTEINAKDRVPGEIVIVIYNINGDPFIYSLGYKFNENIGYVLAKDFTRIDIWKTEIIADGINYQLPDEYSKIVVNTNFPEEYYEITVTDTGFSSNAIILKSYSNNYQDIEIARYMIDNK